MTASLTEYDLANSTVDYVTFNIADQLFGVPVTSIHDVFTPTALAPVPLANSVIAGVLNLRGRIVTAIDARTYLQLPPLEKEGHLMAIGIEKDGESYGIIIDSIGEVLTLSGDKYEPNPVNLDARWSDISKGVYRLEETLLIVLDTDRLLQFEQTNAA